MAPDRDRRSLRSLRSDRDDSKERGVAFYTFVSLPGHPGKTTLTREQPPRLSSLENLPQSKRFSFLSVDQRSIKTQGRLSWTVAVLLTNCVMEKRSIAWRVLYTCGSSQKFLPWKDVIAGCPFGT
jgi:hypothetical protein